MKLEKETSNNIERNEDNYKYHLDVDNYNQLVGERATPAILVVFQFPEEPDDFVRYTSEEIVLKKCAYWVSLKSKTVSTNSSTVTIDIPKENILSPDMLNNLMIDAGKNLPDREVLI